MIVLCANPIRLKYLDNMLKKLLIYPFQKKINILPYEITHPTCYRRLT